MLFHGFHVAAILQEKPNEVVTFVQVSLFYISLIFMPKVSCIIILKDIHITNNAISTSYGIPDVYTVELENFVT